MIKQLAYLILFFPEFLFAQHVVHLTVIQPPELGFSVLRQDTTIQKGNSIILGTDLVVFGGSGCYTYKWSPVTTLNNPDILHPLAFPEDTTHYVLTVADKNGCSLSVNYCVNVKSKVVKSDFNLIKQNFDVIIFPNPSDGNPMVKLTGIPSKRIEMTINDPTGKVMKKLAIRNFTGEHTSVIQVNFIPGIYYLSIKSGSFRTARQFIIH